MVFLERIANESERPRDSNHSNVATWQAEGHDRMVTESQPSHS